MSELDLIFSRKKKTEGEEKVNETKIEERKEVPKEEEEKIEQKVEDKNSSNVRTENQSIEKTSTNAEELMRKFIDKDPKIGIWSYPSYLLLQYLYNTIPGFKMSRVAREALEKGLKEMYPELFEIAEKVARDVKKI